MDELRLEVETTAERGTEIVVVRVVEIVRVPVRPDTLSNLVADMQRISYGS